MLWRLFGQSVLDDKTTDGIPSKRNALQQGRIASHYKNRNPVENAQQYQKDTVAFAVLYQMSCAKGILPDVIKTFQERQ